jgi:hypothetical protein
MDPALPRHQPSRDGVIAAAEQYPLASVRTRLITFELFSTNSRDLEEI